MAFSTPDEVVKLIKDENVEYVDIRFTDLPGNDQHFTIAASAFDEDLFEDGLAVDGSSIRGFQSIHESDMMLLPDVATARLDPFRKAKTLNISCFVHDPFTREAYSRDPRNVARKAEEYLASTGIADTCYFGAEAEFFVFDSVRYGSGTNHGFYEVDSIAGHWNTDARTEADGSPNLGYKVRSKGGYFPVAPYDHFVDLRDEMSTHLTNAGFELERLHHEVAGAQQEINYKFNTLLHAADDVQLFKYIVKNTAWKNGKSATFMPISHCGRTVSRSSTTSPATRACPTSPAITSAGSCTTRPHYWRSPTPPLTRITGWCPGTRHLSTSSTPSATAPRACASPSPATTPRPSGSSSGAPTPPGIPTSRSPR